MLAKAAILEGEQHVDVARIDVGDGDREPPAAVHRRVGTEETSLPIEHTGRDDIGLVDGWRQGKRRGEESRSGSRREKDGNARET
jgi:hypothetical protein